jgi:hypothetical protein
VDGGFSDENDDDDDDDDEGGASDGNSTEDDNDCRWDDPARGVGGGIRGVDVEEDDPFLLATGGKALVGEEYRRMLLAGEDGRLRRR